ncbi:MAG: response regulator [Gemmatimonadales bacterium]|jgi:signal transduction histidine kinase|nr:response regulator [Gemmatimonadales bacterium]MBP9897447.1 response regulator [Gemmatimonadales bacterium]
MTEPAANETEAALRLRTTLYHMMAEANRAVLTAENREQLFQALCRIAVDTGRFRFAWIGIPAEGVVKPTTWSGDDGGYLAALQLSLDPSDPTSQGPTGQAVLVGATTVVNDFLSSPLTAPWHEPGQRSGFGASAAFPLLELDRVVAVLSLYAEQPGFFTPELIETLGEITPTVSLALTAFAKAAERSTLEAQVVHAQKMEAVGLLASGVAHDFNNILTVITGCAELLQAEIPGDHPSRELLGEIREAGERARNLTRQLLAFSRQQVVSPRPLDLNDVIGGSEKMIRRLIGSDIALTTELESPLWTTTADPGQLEQVLLNLAVNARDAMPDGGALVMRSHATVLAQPTAEVPAGEFVVLEMADTGTGMTAETRAHLFEPFFTTKPPGMGTGLGLATVATIVRDALGYVTVESEPGKGTTFRVYLPRAEGVVATAVPVSSPGALPRGTETILLVEDDDPLRHLVRTMLRGLGYQVLEAANGAAAIMLSRGRKESIDLLLTDVVMPHLGGRQLADVLLGERPSCRVLFLSGYSSDEMIRRGVVDSAATFLQKPFTVGELAERVRAVLGPAA